MKYSKYYIIFALFIIIVLNHTLRATTWATAKKTSPISGEEISVKVVVSYGSYIYDMPSKYDMVYWPMTDANWIWFDPNNGYAAFGSDFETISNEEILTLKQWLQDNYSPGDTFDSYIEKLLWLKKIYSQRNMDDNFWCKFYRLMAYTYRENNSKSLEYVKKALPLLDNILLSNPQGAKKIETLFLLGEYNRRIGDTGKAKKYFTLARKTEYTDEDGKIRTNHPYIAELINDKYPSESIFLKVISIIVMLVLFNIIVFWYISRKINKAAT